MFKYLVGKKEILKNSTIDDTFILFIAGHGVHDIDKNFTYYYLTYNADINNLSKTAAPFNLIEDILYGNRTGKSFEVIFQIVTESTTIQLFLSIGRYGYKYG